MQRQSTPGVSCELSFSGSPMNSLRSPHRIDVAYVLMDLRDGSIARVIRYAVEEDQDESPLDLEWT